MSGSVSCGPGEPQVKGGGASEPSQQHHTAGVLVESWQKSNFRGGGFGMHERLGLRDEGLMDGTETNLGSDSLKRQHCFHSGIAGPNRDAVRSHPRLACIRPKWWG
ncbi:unnamed protein product [Boreogadus saida]